MIRFSLYYAFLSFQLISRSLPAYGLTLSNTTFDAGVVVGLAEASFDAIKGAKKPSDVYTRNELLQINATACASVGIIFARGTLELGNVGLLAGPQFFAAMADYLNGTNQLAVQGVEYEASIQGFLAGGSDAGASEMTNLINSTISACPSSVLILSGYSQGAQVVHKAADSLSLDLAAKITAVVLFGDPLNGTAFKNIDASKVKTICDEKDGICNGKFNIKPAHLKYSLNATEAAMFALQKCSALGIAS